jgi:hypothetical protein
MTTYLLLLNKEVVEEFDAASNEAAGTRAVELAAKHRKVDSLGSRRYTLAVKGSDGQPGQVLHQWGSASSADPRPLTG